MDIKSTITFEPDNTKRTNVKITCIYNTADNPQALHFIKSGTILFYCNLKSLHDSCKRMDDQENRYRVGQTQKGTVSFSVQSLECGDEGEYGCRILQNLPLSSDLKINNSIMVLDQRAKPHLKINTMSKTVLLNPMVKFQSNVDEIHLELKSFKIDHNSNGTVKTPEESLQQYVETCTDYNETIFQSTTDSGITLLMLKAFYGCTKLADVILNRNGEVNKTSKKGITALMLCSHQGHMETAETLINNGADVNAADEYGMTAFMNSSLNGHIKISELLIDRGANINCVNTHGYSSLDMAFFKGHFDVIKLILRQRSMVKNGFLEANQIVRQQIRDVMIEESDAGTSRGLLAQHFPRDWGKGRQIGNGFSCDVYLVKDNSTSSESQYVVKEIKLTSTKSTNYLYLGRVLYLPSVLGTCPVFTISTWDMSCIYHQYLGCVLYLPSVLGTCPVFTISTWDVSCIYHQYLGCFLYLPSVLRHVLYLPSVLGTCPVIYYQYLGCVLYLLSVLGMCPVFTISTWDVSCIYYQYLGCVLYLLSVLGMCPVFTISTWDVSCIYHQYLGCVMYLPSVLGMCHVFTISTSTCPVFTISTWDMSCIYYQYLGCVLYLPSVLGMCPVFTISTWDVSCIYHQYLGCVMYLPSVLRHVLYLPSVLGMFPVFTISTSTCPVFTISTWDMSCIYHQYL
ncbi:hypothetical protein Btru_059122 [Bulinus truncatus]|nr:hypothetical protein Btru_059122 [Bulinus truncatus]